MKIVGDYYDAINKHADRYLLLVRDIIDDNDYWGWSDDRKKYTDLRDFIQKIKWEASSKKLPITKLNRWFGYVQGCLIFAGHTTVEAERNITRNDFRLKDFPTNHSELCSKIIENSTIDRIKQEFNRLQC